MTRGWLLTRLDLRDDTTVAEIPVGARPFPVTVGEGGIWVKNEQDSTVSRIDPKTNQVVAAIPAEDGHNLWLLGIAGTVRLINPLRYRGPRGND